MIKKFIISNFIIIIIYFFYVSFVTITSHFFLNEAANGSIIKKGNRIIGSKLLSQNLQSSKYFQSSDSLSKLDPYISISNADSQIHRISKIRKISSSRLKSLINKYTVQNLYSDKLQVNTFELNLALDKYFGKY